MLLSGFNDVDFVGVSIAGEIIMWFFVAIAVIAFIIFLFNLIFISPASKIKKDGDQEAIKLREDFERQIDEVDVEVELILRVEEEDLEINSPTKSLSKKK